MGHLIAIFNSLYSVFFERTTNNKENHSDPCFSYGELIKHDGAQMPLENGLKEQQKSTICLFDLAGGIRIIWGRKSG